MDELLALGRWTWPRPRTRLDLGGDGLLKLRFADHAGLNGCNNQMCMIRIPPMKLRFSHGWVFCDDLQGLLYGGLAEPA